ncbi:MAG TPA: tetratricopeptide repeat protein [Candidatus Polarisedimenticolia bacterium]|nr:tetratricopeptide repeat protein [Candidatus Polarisedimenticolia bacterium]
MTRRLGRLARAFLFLAALLAPGCSRRSAPEPPLTTPQQRSPELQAILTEAGSAYQRGNLTLTEEALRRASAMAPDDADLALDLGDTLTRAQHLDAARQHYEAFLARHPSSAAVRLALGLTLTGLGRWEDAAREIGQVAERTPDDPVARLNLGIVLSKLGRYDASVEQLRRAVELTPTDPVAVKELGSALMSAGKLQEAATALEQAVALDARSAPAWFALGGCYARLGRKAEAAVALAHFSETSEGKERFLDQKRLFRAAQGRAEALSLQGKDEEALAALLAYRDALQDFPQFQQELGVAYLRLGKRTEAIAALERAVAGDRTLREAYGHLAVLYQQQGDTDKAMRARRSALHPSGYGSLPVESP